MVEKLQLLFKSRWLEREFLALVVLFYVASHALLTGAAPPDVSMVPGVAQPLGHVMDVVNQFPHWIDTLALLLGYLGFNKTRREVKIAKAIGEAKVAAAAAGAVTQGSGAGASTQGN